MHHGGLPSHHPLWPGAPSLLTTLTRVLDIAVATVITITILTFLIGLSLIVVLGEALAWL